MSRIFISYKRVDKDKVFTIKEQIESALGEKCWIDLDGIESDAQFVSVIITAIEQADIILFMYSREHSLITDYENDWTIRELNYAKEEKQKDSFHMHRQNTINKMVQVHVPPKATDRCFEC